MFVVESKDNRVSSLPAKEIKAQDAKAFGSPLAIKIVNMLAVEEMYPIEIAKRLKLNEQKVYYHIRNLEKAGIIAVTREEDRQGARAKYFALQKPAFVVRFKDLEDSSKVMQLRTASSFLEPFVADGQLNAMIIVGSPDPHGPDKARSRDGYYGMDLALFLGTYLSYVPASTVKLDTEAREEDLKNNHLILIGGPVVNKIVGKVNKFLPIRFDAAQNYAVTSTISGNVYPSDETGIIVKAKNPFNKDKRILVVAGKRYTGTRAAIIAFLKHFSEVTSGNLHNNTIAAKIVEGVDLDSDGIVDDVEIRE